jgi:hypothetical protein
MWCFQMTAEDNYNKVSDMSLLHHNSPITNINLDCQEQESSYLCDECGFAPCICEYIVRLDAETGFRIVDNGGEL